MVLMGLGSLTLGHHALSISNDKSGGTHRSARPEQMTQGFGTGLEIGSGNTSY